MDEQTPTIVINNEPKPKNTTRNILLAAIGVLALVILFGWCRGYRNGLAATDAIEQQKKLVKQFEANQKALNDTLAFLREDSARAARDADEAAALATQLDDSLAKAQTYTKYLATRVKEAYKERDKALGKLDTIDIIDNCDDLADAYLKEVDRSNELKDQYKRLDTIRLKQLDAQKKIADSWKGRADTCQLMFNTLLMAAKSTQVRTNIKAGITGMYSPFVAGIGASVALEDRKGKLFQASVTATDKGLVYQGSVLLKLSFRKR